MSSAYKDYLGTIEIQIDDLHYEIGLRQEDTRCLRGLWTCMQCGKTAIASELKPTEGEAIELAKIEVREHHGKLHRVECGNSSRQNG